ncbi:uncharacterized protein LOC126821662 isoform X2 [Patella vulgata]|uniref:uncharacterized protein LOC126821662 isoform X2 n=1 Tax=Patella vulgata TaxID=6465 RepID=UPI0024A855A1|nr:uncharacterized protein LOC126821662 isoform X2 [Patella vulgata]
MATKSISNGDISSRDATSRTQAKKEVTNLMGLYLLVVGAVASAWAFGYFEFSFLWVFLLSACLFLVWKTKIGTIIRRHLDYEEDNLHRKRALRQSESVEWLNFLLNRWWVFSTYSIEDLVKKRLDERLIGITPSFIEKLELKTFTVGDQTPNIKHVRVFEFCEGVPGGHSNVTWVNVNQPPAGMDKMSSYKIVLETDLTLHCEDFKMVFRAKVGNKKVSLGFDMSIDDLNITGTMQAIVHLSMDIPFPHVSKATISFVEKPDVTFNIHMLRAIQLMEVPLLKSWIYNNVMEGLTKAMVDPASVDLHFAKAGPIQVNRSSIKEKKAHGVLTIKIKGTPHDEAIAEDIRYCVLRIGDRKRETRDVPAINEWEDVCSFFIYDVADEKLEIKQKCKRLLTSTVVESHTIKLSAHPFRVQSKAEDTFTNSDGSKLKLDLEYTALPKIDLETEPANQQITNSSGVMYVKIHGAANVIAADRTGASDPYCVLFSDRRRIFTTPYIPETRNPRWETGVEFFVSNVAKTNLSFFVFDWDGTNTIDDDFLGSAHFSLSEDESWVIKKNLTLGYNDPKKGYVQDRSCGEITISVIFRPVPSVGRSEKYRAFLDSISSNNNDYLYREDLMSPATSSAVYGKPQSFPGSEGPLKAPSHARYMDTYLEGKTIVELTILQGKDLVSMDRNGFSDPFCVVLLDKKKVFTTGVKKKTLFPKWNETVTLEYPTENSEMEIDVYDKDILGKDFMGKLFVELDKLKELSLKGTSEWFSLDRAKSGKIQLRCSVISKDMVNKDISFDVTSNSEVFDSSMEQTPQKQSQIPTMSTDNGHMINAQNDSDAPQLNRKQSATLDVGPNVQLRRSGSDINVNNNTSRSRPTQSFNEHDTQSMGRRGFTGGMRSAGSVNSIAFGGRGDNLSVGSSIAGDKVYSVKGQVLQAKGLVRMTSEIYCKVRVDQPGNRISLFSSTRVIAKSPMVKSSYPTFNLPFEIDRGHGISSDATIIFDIKRSSKEHLATRAFTLRHLLAEADDEGTVRTTLLLQNNIEIDIVISHGKPSPHRKRLINNLSFRKDKHL